MSKILSEWTVQPHGPLVTVDDGLLTVEGEIRMPLGNFPRRMTAARLARGTTAIWSAIALAEPEMRRIEALGAPEYLIVPNAAHRLDARIWKQRYPAIKLVCAPGAVDAVSEAAPVDATGDVLGDPEARLEIVDGMGESELAMHILRSGEATLVLNDTLANVRHPHGLGAAIMARLFGFGVKGPRTPKPVISKLVEDRAALAAAFRRWAGDPALRRIIVSHGDVIERDPADALNTAAGILAG